MASGTAATRRSAAEIRKPELPLLILSEREVIELLDPARLLDALAEGFRALGRGDVQAPARPEITVPGAGFLLPMAAWQQGGEIAVKTVAVFEGNLDRSLPNHLALVNLFDAATGVPLCVMDGTHITGIRTAAAAVLSVRTLARPEARVAAIVGAGVQAREHLALLDLVRPFDEIRIASLYPEDAAALARLRPGAVAVRDVEAAVRGADVVCLCTHSSTPVIDPSWIAAGTHVTSVGYAPPGGELPAALARDHALFVEARAAFAPSPEGCAELAGISPAHGTDLGAVLDGTAAGRTSGDEITVYKAMGIAMEDMVAARLAYAEAVRRGIGTRVAI